MSSCSDDSTQDLDDLEDLDMLRLFTKQDLTPIVFALRICEEKLAVTELVQEHGGEVVTTRSGPHTMALLPRGESNYSPVVDAFSTQYVYDCVKNKELLDPVPYRVNKVSVYEGEVPLKDIMRGLRSWAEFTRRAQGAPAEVFSDFSDDENTMLKPKKMFKTGRRPYSQSEGRAMLQYIHQHRRHQDLKGNTVWKEMEQRQVCVGRTWQSMKEHFNKTVMANIQNYTDKDTQKKFYQGFFNRAKIMEEEDDPDIVEEEQPRRRQEERKRRKEMNKERREDKGRPSLHISDSDSDVMASWDEDEDEEFDSRHPLQIPRIHSDTEIRLGSAGKVRSVNSEEQGNTGGETLDGARVSKRGASVSEGRARTAGDGAEPSVSSRASSTLPDPVQDRGTGSRVQDRGTGSRATDVSPTPSRTTSCAASPTRKHTTSTSNQPNFDAIKSKDRSTSNQSNSDATKSKNTNTSNPVNSDTTKSKNKPTSSNINSENNSTGLQTNHTCEPMNSKKKHDSSSSDTIQLAHSKRLSSSDGAKTVVYGTKTPQKMSSSDEETVVEDTLSDSDREDKREGVQEKTLAEIHQEERQEKTHDEERQKEINKEERKKEIYEEERHEEQKESDETIEQETDEEENLSKETPRAPQERGEPRPGVSREVNRKVGHRTDPDPIIQKAAECHFVSEDGRTTEEERGRQKRGDRPSIVEERRRLERGDRPAVEQERRESSDNMPANEEEERMKRRRDNTPVEGGGKKRNKKRRSSDIDEEDKVIFETEEEQEIFSTSNEEEEDSRKTKDVKEVEQRTRRRKGAEGEEKRRQLIINENEQEEKRYGTRRKRDTNDQSSNSKASRKIPHKGILQHKVFHGYTAKDDIAILTFLDEHKAMKLGGNAVWDTLARQKVVPKRSWQSLKERFRRRIAPRLEYYLQFGVDPSVIRRVEARIGAQSPDDKLIEDGRHSRTGAYTYQEDRQILEYILTKKVYALVKGRWLWQVMAKRATGLKGRTWQSLKNRFAKHISRKLSTYHLAEEEIENIKAGLMGQIRDRDEDITTRSSDQSTIARTRRHPAYCSPEPMAGPSRQDPKQPTIMEVMRKKKIKLFNQQEGSRILTPGPVRDDKDELVCRPDSHGQLRMRQKTRRITVDSDEEEQEEDVRRTRRDLDSEEDECEDVVSGKDADEDDESDLGRENRGVLRRDQRKGGRQKKGNRSRRRVEEVREVGGIGHGVEEERGSGMEEESPIIRKHTWPVPKYFTTNTKRTNFRPGMSPRVVLQRLTHQEIIDLTNDNEEVGGKGEEEREVIIVKSEIVDDEGRVENDGSGIAEERKGEVGIKERENEKRIKVSEVREIGENKNEDRDMITNVRIKDEPVDEDFFSENSVQICNLIHGGNIIVKEESISADEEENSLMEEENAVMQGNNVSIEEENVSLQENNVSTEEENESIQENNVSIQEENASIQEENASIQEENTSIHEENTSIQGELTSTPRRERIRSTNEPVQTRSRFRWAQHRSDGESVEKNRRKSKRTRSLSLEHMPVKGLRVKRLKDNKINKGRQLK